MPTTPRWIRSWPTVIPPERAYVQDGMERLVIRDYDYATLPEEDLFLLEWDIALDYVGRERFEQLALQTPARALVAPYYLSRLVSPDPVWCHRKVDGRFERWVETNEPTCDYFSLGCVYLPRDLIQQFKAADPVTRGISPRRPPETVPQGGDPRTNDQTISIWHHYFSGRGPVPIAWDVRPQHLC